MKIKFNKSLYSFKRRSKTLRKKRKDFENEIKEIIANSVMAQNNNKELAEKNVNLLAEIEVLKKEKLELFQRFMFRLNPNQTMIKNELMVLLETLKSEHKKFVQMFETTNNFYTQMIDTISDKIEDFIKFEDNKNVDNVSNEVTPTRIQAKCQQIYEMRRMSRQNCSPNEDSVDRNVLNLSIIPEVTQEVSNIQNMTKDTEYTLVESQFQSPIIQNQCMSSSVTDYELTPHFSNQVLRTPSIYNFDSNSFRGLRNVVMNESNDTSVSPFDMSLRPELSLSGYNSFNTILSDEQTVRKASTPVNSNCLTTIEMIRRPSKRISSINRPYSPRIGRQSLIDIRNVIENKKTGKQSVLLTDCEIKANEMIESQTNETNSLNVTKKKKKRKKCDTIEIKSELLESDTSEMSANSNLSIRSSRRNKKPVSYKEPSISSKIRRPLN